MHRRLICVGLILCVGCGARADGEDADGMSFLEALFSGELFNNDGGLRGTDTGFFNDDWDNDGFSVKDGDCDDEAPLVHPDSVELCNGIDDDCDGTVDEEGAIDGEEWHRDLDRDGYGRPGEAPLFACTQPDGYVTNQRDCNDSSADASPDRAEVCDGIDNDCDGIVDEGSAEDALPYLIDADGDGFGSIYEQHVSCAQPDGFVLPVDADSGDPWDVATWVVDCNDSRPDINPDGTEVCDDLNFDEDCDGLINASDPDVEFCP
ncbi:MAG: putative metal-binding motif-containing protein [Myxococcota bacterium]